MTNETISATITIKAPAETVFGVLANPASHAAIDGTGWVRKPLDVEQLAKPGQIFRMAMYHDDHPDGHYQMAFETEVKLSYDWSAVPHFLREQIQFPPFTPDHLHNSLNHLAKSALAAH
ncbi:MAG TPA: polyketide cyclase [Pseudonocardiaceae bacterium]